MKARPCQGVTAPPTRPTEGAQQLGQQRTFTAYVHAGYWTPDNPEVHMPASIKRIRESWNVRPTARDKGLTLTLKVTAYDNGMIEVDGIPINVEPAYDQGHGWLGRRTSSQPLSTSFARTSSSVASSASQQAEPPALAP
jgi:hypothetical protein